MVNIVVKMLNFVFEFKVFDQFEYNLMINMKATSMLIKNL